MWSAKKDSTALSRWRARRTIQWAALIAVTGAVVGGVAALQPEEQTTIGAPSIRNVDGGADYYARFNASLPSGATFFPVAVWSESVLEARDTATDIEAGINTYVELTANTNLQLISDAGMFAIPSSTTTGGAGFLLPDEPDMWAGPGDAQWTGNFPGQGEICLPAGARCGYTIQQTILGLAPTGTLVYANYGKGVAFWETDAEAAKFVNDFSNIVSADTYWFTDPNICGPGEGGRGGQLSQDECRLAANYGWTVERVRSLVSPQGSKPVWAFVEVGHPFTEDDAPTITGPQIRAAVWSSIIHGARGIVYFNHNFGGSCESQHVLRDACGAEIRPTVTAVNNQIATLAPVLNAPFVDGLVSTDGKVDLAVKIHDGSFYVLAASTQPGSQTVAFTSTCRSGQVATVLGEDRAVPIENGGFSDTFADGNTVHIYRIDGDDVCGVVP